MVVFVSVLDSPRELEEVRAILYELPFVSSTLVSILTPTAEARKDGTLDWRSNLEKEP
jgi:hypothetical protein